MTQHELFRGLMAIVILALICIFTILNAEGQVPRDSVPSVLLELDQVHRSETPSWRQADSIVVYIHNGDTARVYLSEQGRPSIWVARFEGQLWVKASVFGYFIADADEMALYARAQLEPAAQWHPFELVSAAIRERDPLFALRLFPNAP